MGGTIEPNEDQSSPGFIPPRKKPADTVELEATVDVLAAAVAKKKSSDSFESQPGAARARKLDWNDLPSERPAQEKKDPGPSSSHGTRFLENLLAEATCGLSLSSKERDVDVPGGLTMADASSGE